MDGASNNFDFVAGFNHLDRSPLSAAEIPGIAELALSGLGKTFRVLQDTTVNSGIYTGSYSKGDLIPDPNCEENGGNFKRWSLQIPLWKSF